MVKTKWWKKGCRVVQKCYHPECWLKQGYDYLNSNPYIYKYRKCGRKSLKLTDEQRVIRKRLLVKMAKLNQRLAECSKLEDSDSKLVKVSQIMIKKEELRKEIEKYGGVPKSWQ